MARYYDDETLIGFLKQNTPNIDGETTLKSVVRAIHHAPTADVVPKSEYDALQGFLDAAIAGQKTLQTHLANVRAEVAREIFEEIDEKVLLSLPIESFINKPRTTQNCIWNTITELKQKYTEVSK